MVICHIFKHCITRQMDAFQRVVGTWQEPLLYVEVRDDRCAAPATRQWVWCWMKLCNARHQPWTLWARRHQCLVARQGACDQLIARIFILFIVETPCFLWVFQAQKPLLHKRKRTGLVPEQSWISHAAPKPYPGATVVINFPSLLHKAVAVAEVKPIISLLWAWYARGR